MSGIVKRFKSGVDFAQLAVAESDGVNALNGGDLGWKTLEQLPTLFAGSIDPLKSGGISEPIRSANGLHIIQLVEKKGGFETQLVDELKYRQILIKLSKITTDNKAEAKLIEIRKKILSGETDFSEQAKVYSEDLNSASEGGEMLWAPIEAYQQIYGDKVDALKKDELSQPFKSGPGWYLVELMGSRVSDQTDENKRRRAKQILQSRKYQEEQESWLQEIREQAYVKILDAK